MSRAPTVQRAGVLDALEKFAAFTPGFIRTIARDNDVEVDQPEFKEKCRGLTGEAHLDKMSPGQLGQVAKMLWSLDKRAELTKIMPSAPPALIRDNAGAQPVSSEAAKNLAEREGDRRTDYHGPVGGYVLEGAKIAEAVYGVKTAVVPGSVKQYRRAFESMAQRTHDWHGASPANFKKIQTTAHVQPTPKNLNGNPAGVYVARGEPELPYFREGYGVALPADSQSTNPQWIPVIGATNWRGYAQPVAIKAPGFVVAPTSAERRTLQETHRLRPLDPEALTKAYTRFDEVHADRWAKLADHVQDRRAERTPFLSKQQIEDLRAAALKLEVEPGPYHTPLKDRHGLLVGHGAFRVIDGKLVMTTILGKDMKPKGTSLSHVLAVKTAEDYDPAQYVSAMTPQQYRKLLRQFERYQQQLKTEGVATGTGHDRIPIPKTELSEDQIRALGFLPDAGIPEKGQDRFSTYRHPDHNYHIHSHPTAWTMHEDSHPAFKMVMHRRQGVVDKARGFAEGVPHFFTEGVPGAAIYTANQVKQLLAGTDRTMLDAIAEERRARGLPEKTAAAGHSSPTSLQYWKDYLNHSALNAGQAARDVRYLTNHPNADAVAPEGSMRHRLESLKHRIPSLANNAKYTLLPPQWHHTPADLADMGIATPKQWFMSGYDPWNHKIPGDTYVAPRDPRGEKLGFEKVADALRRAVQRGEVTPSRENASRLRAQMRQPMTPRATQKTLADFGRPATRGAHPGIQTLRAGLSEAGPVRPSDVASRDRRSQILEKSFAPAAKMHGAQPKPPGMGGPAGMFVPNKALDETPLSVGHKLKPYDAVMLESASKRNPNVSRDSIQRQAPLPGGTIMLAAPAGLASEGSPRAMLEHEVGERWHHDQHVRGKPSTPYASHLGPEATVREWGFAAQDDDAWRKAQALRAPDKSQPADGDQLFARAYRQAGGTQNAPVPFDSRQSRAIARHYDRAYAKDHPALWDDAAKRLIPFAREGGALSPGAEKAAIRERFRAQRQPVPTPADLTQLQHDWAKRLGLGVA